IGAAAAQRDKNIAGRHPARIGGHPGDLDSACAADRQYGVKCLQPHGFPFFPMAPEGAMRAYRLETSNASLSWPNSGLTPSSGAARRMTAATVGAAFRPAVAPIPGISGFGSSRITNTT